MPVELTKPWNIDEIHYCWIEWLIETPYTEPAVDFDNDEKSRVIEKIFLGIPIGPITVVPFSTKDCNKIIVDGAKRVKAIKDFCANNLKMSGLQALFSLNGATYLDLSEEQRFEFKCSIIHIVKLEEHDEDAINYVCSSNPGNSHWLKHGAPHE